MRCTILAWNRKKQIDFDSLNKAIRDGFKHFTRVKGSTGLVTLLGTAAPISRDAAQIVFKETKE